MSDKLEINIHIMDADSSVEKISDTLYSSAQLAVDKIKGILPLENCDIVICNNPGSTIPETGAGGFSPNPNLIFVYINTASKIFLSNIGITIVRTITHELHHASRSIMYPWENPSILESFITEGLADNFDIEVNGCEPYPWSVALSEEKISSLIQKANGNGWEKLEGDFWSWNFGTDVPKWSGYSIGFKLVRDYMDEYNKTATELVHTNAHKFIRGL